MSRRSKWERESVDLGGMACCSFSSVITGLLEQRFTKARMGLSAHLERVMNGILLLGLGAAWNKVRPAHRINVTAYHTAVYNA